ncbi:rhodanese-like domain-containing protein [Romboutsia sp.]|uniref:rhodanese-like domain-containing protein n=1 Tax=Romboutsia sp. TaxID=1965302 RepID=UPI003F3D3376
MYINIDNKKLDEMINNNEETLLLDIREVEEFNEGFIPKAINIPINKLLFNIDDIEEYKGKNIVVYCRSGHRSITACNLLSMEGFENLYNLEKGILGYNLK